MTTTVWWFSNSDNSIAHQIACGIKCIQQEYSAQYAAVFLHYPVVGLLNFSWYGQHVVDFAGEVFNLNIAKIAHSHVAA